MQINDTWRITTDPYNVILQKLITPSEKRKEGDTTDRWANEGYYPSHKAALRGMIERELKIPQEYQDVISKIEELHSLIESLDMAERDTARYLTQARTKPICLDLEE